MNRTYHRSFLNVQINIPCSSEQENREKKLNLKLRELNAVSQILNSNLR